MQIQNLASTPRHTPSSVWSEILALAAALPIAVFVDALRSPAAPLRRAQGLVARSAR